MTETGHAKNIANFSQVISIVTGLGPVYNPGNAAIQLPQLEQKRTDIRAAFEAVAPLEATEILAVNERMAVFEPLARLVTRVSSAAAVGVNDELFSNDLRTLARKLQGRRATPKAVPAMPAGTAEPVVPAGFESPAFENGEAALPENGQTPGSAPPVQLEAPKKNISASQMSYDNRLAHFAEFITLLETTGGYAPNETELRTETLRTLLADMETGNASVVNTGVAARNARIERDRVLYNDADGIIVLVNLVKKYIKSVLGPESPQYRQLTKLKFRKP
jgi:hypothetical protein